MSSDKFLAYFFGCCWYCSHGRLVGVNNLLQRFKLRRAVTHFLSFMKIDRFLDRLLWQHILMTFLL